MDDGWQLVAGGFWSETNDEGQWTMDDGWQLVAGGFRAMDDRLYNHKQSFQQVWAAVQLGSGVKEGIRLENRNL